jgi:hypothetical protein
VLLQLWQPIPHLYSTWDRVSDLIVSGSLDPEKFDVLMISQGRTPSGLSAAQVRSDPTSRPGGYDVVANWLLPPNNHLLNTIPAAIVALTGLLIIRSATSIPATRPS